MRADSPTRQQEILTLFAQGMSYAQIAEVRGKRPLTIRNSIYGIQRKLQAKSKQEMVVWGREERSAGPIYQTPGS